MAKDSKGKKDLEIYLSRDLPSLYSNAVNISASDKDVVFDFIIIGPAGDNDAKVISRIYMTKQTAKKFHKIFNDIIKKL